MKKRGSALIGVLIALTILVIAVAIVYPSFSRARARAMAASCLSNVKQLGIGFAMYATDYDDKLPLYDNGSKPGYVTAPLGQVAKGHTPLITCENYSRGTNSTLMPYTKNGCILWCPSAICHCGGCGDLSYTLNGLFLGAPQDKIEDPKDKIFMIDECSISDYVFLSYTAPAYSEHRLAEPDHMVHFHGLNCLYADGHAQWMSKKDWPGTPASPGFWRFGVTTKPGE